MKIIDKILNRFGYIKTYKSNITIKKDEFKILIAYSETRYQIPERIQGSALTMSPLEKAVLKENILKCIENNIEYNVLINHETGELIFNASLKLAVPK